MAALKMADAKLCHACAPAMVLVYSLAREAEVCKCKYLCVLQNSPSWLQILLCVCYMSFFCAGIYWPVRLLHISLYVSLNNSCSNTLALGAESSMHLAISHFRAHFCYTH